MATYVFPAAAWCRLRLRRALTQALLAGGAALLAACGGGGGDSSSGGSAAPAPAPASASAPAENLAIAYDRSTVEATWSEGTTPGALVVQATGTGATQRALFIGAATADGQGDANLERVDVSVSGTSATVTIVPAAGLAVGRHEGTLTLRACYDSDCTEQVSGSPTTIRYAFTVNASPLRTDPASLGLVAFAGETVTGSFKVIGATAGRAPSVTPRDAWLRTSVQAGSGDPVVQVEAVAGPAGTQTTAVDIESDGLKYTLPVTLQSVAQRMSLSTKQVEMKALAGSTVCRATVGVGRIAPGTGGFTVTPTSPWFAVTAQSANSFELTAEPLPLGLFFGTVVVRSGTDVEVLPVRCSVGTQVFTPRVPLSLARPSVTLWAPEGGTSATQTLGVTPPSWNPVVQSSVAYAQGAGWLNVTPTATGDLQLAASAAGLAAGTYDATVTVTGGHPSVPVTARVRLTVGGALAWPAMQAVTLGSDTPTSKLSGTIGLAGRSDVVRWIAGTATPWLRLDTSGGDLATPLAYRVDVAQALLQPAYADVVGTIAIQGLAADGSTLATVTAPVLLRRELAEITGIGPGTVVAGKDVGVIVRGRGFAALASPATWVKVNGAAPASAVVVSDTAMRVYLTAPAAGDATLKVTNAFGVDTAGVTLHVVDPVAATAAALPTGGSPWSIVHDPQRRQVFVANPALGAVQRWREQSGAWVADKLDVADLADIALSVDGGTLFVARSTGQVLLVDPAALTVRSRHDAPARLYPLPKLGTGLAVTNDGKLWLTTIDSKPIVFDLATRTFAEPRFDGVATAFNGGPWFMASRNGERLVAVQSTAGAPMLAMDASVGQWRANPVDLTYFYWPLNGLGDDGRRLLVMGGVWQYDYAAIGRQLLPLPGWIDSAAVLSPDGSRLYVFALPPTWNLAGSTQTPKVFVFDTSQSVGTNAALPLVDTIEVPWWPTCRVESASAGACVRPAMTVSADGNTLFIAGESKLVVLPVWGVLENVAVTLSPQRIVAEKPTGTSLRLPVKATLSPVPSGQVHAVVRADQPLFVEGLVPVERNADGSYSASLSVRSDLPLGTHSSTLELLLCRDSACTIRYPLTGNTLPFTVTVLRPLALSMTVNAASVPLAEPPYLGDTRVRVGDRIVVTSDEPTRWTTSGAAVFTDVVTTATSWSATVALPDGVMGVLSAQSIAHPGNLRRASFIVLP